MIGYLCNATLRGFCIWLGHHIGRAEVIAYLALGYEIGKQVYGVVQVVIGYYFIVGGFHILAVVLAGYYKMHAQVADALIGHGQ